MITIDVLKRCTDNLAQRRFRPAPTTLAQIRRPDNSPSLQPTHSITVSIINPSYACLPTASKDTALPRSHPPRQPNPHSGVRGILRAPSPAGSFLGGFRTPATGVCRADVAGPHPKPSTLNEPALRERAARGAEPVAPME